MADELLTSWEVVGEDGGFQIVDYWRGDRTIRLQMPPPRDEQTLQTVVESRAPTPEQFAATAPSEQGEHVGEGGVIVPPPPPPEPPPFTPPFPSAPT